MPPNILIVLGIAAIFALFLSDNTKNSEKEEKENARMVSHGRNRISSGSSSGLGKRRAKRNGSSLRVSHFIEDDKENDDIIEQELEDKNLKEEKEEKQQNA